MKTSWVTVGLPFYNNERTLALAIKSVLAQTLSDWLLLLVDDGSTDNSLEIAKAFAERDDRIRLISDKENRGLVARLNQITKLAETKYLARMDGDDIMIPERLGKQLSFLLKNPDVDVIDSAIYTIDKDNMPVGKRNFRDINEDIIAPLLHVLLVHPAIMGKREWFAANPYDDRFTRAEDYELWCRTYRFSKFGRVTEPLLIYREGKVNILNYKRGSRTVRKIIGTYGRPELPVWKIMGERAKSHAKVILYSIFAMFNRQDYLSRKRNIPLNSAEKTHVIETINYIKTFG